LPQLFAELNIRSIIDAPCGDFNWMQHVIQDELDYRGMDVVPAIVAQNQSRYAKANINFLLGDITQGPLSAADLIICRDGLVHVPLQAGCRALHQFKRSGAKYLLATTYPATSTNRDAPVGSWRSLNLCLPPFNLAAPLQVLSDPSDDTGAHPDKSLGLWDLNAIALPPIPRWSSLNVVLATWIREKFDPSWRL
jgi:hypothetical protein